MWTFLGLGNPGSEYEGTRHNLGYEVLDVLAARAGIRFTGGGRHYAAGEGLLRDVSVLLVKPTRFMNRSGLAWRELSETETFDAGKALVVFDDLALPLGKLRLRTRGSDGGHNGLASILKAAGHDKVKRIRMGIGGDDRDWVDHVLSPFTSAEQEIVDGLVALAADAAEAVLTVGMETAMNRYSGNTIGD